MSLDRPLRGLISLSHVLKCTAPTHFLCNTGFSLGEIEQSANHLVRRGAKTHDRRNYQEERGIAAGIAREPRDAGNRLGIFATQGKAPKFLVWIRTEDIRRALELAFQAVLREHDAIAAAPNESRLARSK